MVVKTVCLLARLYIQFTDDKKKGRVGQIANPVDHFAIWSCRVFRKTTP